MGPASTGVVGLEKFAGDNWQLWSIKAKLVFRGNDLWGIVSGDERRPVEASGSKPDSEVRITQRYFDQRNSRALSIIGLSLSDDILAASGIGLMESAADAWHKLESTYAARTLLSRLRLHQQFSSLSMHEGEDVQTFLNSVKSAAHELRASGFELSDEQVVLRIFEGLPESWQPMVITLEARDVRDLTLELVEARLLHERLRRQKRSTLADGALQGMALLALKKGGQEAYKWQIELGLNSMAPVFTA